MIRVCVRRKVNGFYLCLGLQRKKERMTNETKPRRQEMWKIKNGQYGDCTLVFPNYSLPLSFSLNFFLIERIYVKWKNKFFFGHFFFLNFLYNAFIPTSPSNIFSLKIYKKKINNLKKLSFETFINNFF